MTWMETLGFGSRRRSALQAFDAALTKAKVNPAYVDDGMRFAIYKWAAEEEVRYETNPGHIDRRLAEAADLMSFCVIGPTETEAEFGPRIREQRQVQFDAIVARADDDAFDSRIVKLVLAKGIAAPEIAALVELA